MEAPHEHPLPAAACWELLRSCSLGRIALTVDALPTILPVEYFLDGDEIAICLGHHPLTARTVDDAVVGLAADAVDPAARTGWSVQVHGVARLARPAIDCGHHEPGRLVRITPVLISGRRFELCPRGADLPAFVEAARPHT